MWEGGFNCRYTSVVLFCCAVFVGYIKKAILINSWSLPLVLVFMDVLLNIDPCWDFCVGKCLTDKDTGDASGG